VAIKKALDDGYLELMPHTVHPDMAMMVDEDGRRKNLFANSRATALQHHTLMRGNTILGSAVLIGRSGPELASCPMSRIEVIEYLTHVAGT
jgi:hypothetical protein